MDRITARLEAQDWDEITGRLNSKGFSLVKDVLTKTECQTLVSRYDAPGTYRKTVVMERHRYGAGEYKYFRYPLPAMLTAIRQTVYPYLVPVANQWMTDLNIDKTFPPDHQTLQAQCRQAGQNLPTVLILKYGEGGFNTLHQDLYGEVYFPMQAVFFLNEPGKDFSGGEFVLTEQMPRAQSRVNVFNPRRGDMLIFTTSFRPEKGSRGYYRVNVKHGVSPLHSGRRHTLGIIFHDALR